MTRQSKRDRANLLREICGLSHRWSSLQPIPPLHSTSLLVWYNQETRVAYENELTSEHSYSSLHKIIHFETKDGTTYSTTLRVVHVPIYLHPENRE